jgi:hypothetical protein
VVSFTPRPLYPQGKTPWYPLDRRLGRPQGPSGLSGEDKNYIPFKSLVFNKQFTANLSVMSPPTVTEQHFRRKSFFFFPCLIFFTN